MIDIETIQEMRLQAQMCDDYSQWKREMDAIERLERDLGVNNRPPVDQPKVAPIKREYVPRKGHVRANSIDHALELMDQFFNRKQQLQQQES